MRRARSMALGGPLKPKPGSRTAQSTVNLAHDWVGKTMREMVTAKRLPNLGPGYSDEKRAEEAVLSIVGRKEREALTTQQARFWSEVKRDVLDRRQKRLDEENRRLEKEGFGMARGRRRSVSIPRAHLREDIREARSMVRELQRGIRRDQRALGGTREEHANMANSALTVAKRSLESARGALSKGNCKAAVEESFVAVDASRSAMNEARWSSGLESNTAYPRAQTVLRQVSELVWREVIPACVAKRKV